MKKWTALLLTLALALSATSAMAAGKLTVNQETYVAAEGYSLKSYIFAEVENTGEATKLILAQPALFTDYEITKGNMDDVFLAATGKKLHGGAEV